MICINIFPYFMKNGASASILAHFQKRIHIKSSYLVSSGTIIVVIFFRIVNIGPYELTTVNCVPCRAQSPDRPAHFKFLLFSEA
jgi:hypothetical protein